MMCGQVRGFRKLNFPNWLFDDESLKQQKQHNMTTKGVDPCSIGGVEALLTIYPLKLGDMGGLFYGTLPKMCDND